MAYETSLTAPPEANQGEEVRIEANIECLASSGQCSSQTFEIEIDGVVAKSDSYALTAGSSTSRGVGRGDGEVETDEWVITDEWSGDIVFKEPGSYTVTLTGTDGTNESQTVTVIDATYSYDFSVPSEVEVGDSVVPSLETCCTNANGCINADQYLYLNGNLIGHESTAFVSDDCSDRTMAGVTADSSLDLYETDEYTLGEQELTFDLPGEYVFEVETSDGFYDEQTIEVTGGPEVEVVGCDLSTGRVEVGETFEATATIENVGVLDGETVVQLMDGDGEIGRETVVVPGGEDVDVAFEVVYETPGEYDIEYSAAKPATFEVLMKEIRVV